jgi:hypothetical protein
MSSEAIEQRRRDGMLTYTSFASFEDADEADRRYWLSRTPIERLEALEAIRAMNYGYSEEDQTQQVFQRVYRAAELARR